MMAIFRRWRRKPAQIVRIAYFSMAQPQVDDAAAAAIAELSAASNAHNHITGALLFNRRSFMQVLEGPAEQVWPVYERIARDPRHDNVRLVWDGLAEHRAFAGWGMMLVNPLAAPTMHAEPPPGLETELQRMWRSFFRLM